MRPILTATLSLSLLCSAFAAAPHQRSRAIPERPETTIDLAQLPSAKSLIHDVRSLPPLNDEERAFLAQKEGKLQLVKNGIVRDMTPRLELSGMPVAKLMPTSSGLVAYRALVTTEGAAAIRLHFATFNVPSGVRLFLTSPDRTQIEGPYDTPGEFWSNTIFGESAVLELIAPAESMAHVQLALDQVAHMVKIEPQATECFRDASCATTAEFPDLDTARKTIALMYFIKDRATWTCTGSLLASSVNGDTTPYFLTANHCLSTQAAATSLESYFFFRTPTCNGETPSTAAVPHTKGATLLATDPTSDFTFLRLDQPAPSGAVLAGWDATDYAHTPGKILHRLHHPAGGAMSYTRSTVINEPPDTCPEAPQGRFYWSTNVTGGTMGGSSGGPILILDNENYSYVTGQLFGVCSESTDPCTTDPAYRVDGSLAVTYPFISQWLDPKSSGPCVASPTTMCLGGTRFKVEVEWTDFAGHTGTGKVVSGATSQSGLFWFFDSANWEMVVKVLNGCGVNQHYWVFAAATTNVAYTLTVTDTQTGAVKTYRNPLGTSAAAITDTAAFPACP